jgi:hypothetical protein
LRYRADGPAYGDAVQIGLKKIPLEDERRQSTSLKHQTAINARAFKARVDSSLLRYFLLPPRALRAA